MGAPCDRYGTTDDVRLRTAFLLCHSRAEELEEVLVNKVML